MNIRKQKITPFLMFNGTAEAAVEFYTKIFRNSQIISMHKYGAEGPGREGTVNHALFVIGGVQFMAIDNANGTDIPFTPAMSYAVHCDSEEEIDYLYERLKEDGEILMEIAPLPPVAQKFAWVADRFGVNWQLNYPMD